MKRRLHPARALWCSVLLVLVPTASLVSAPAAGTDGGSKVEWKWRKKMTGIDGKAPIRGIAVHHSNSNVAYALTHSSGVYKTTNGGASWTAKNAGLPSTQLYWEVSFDRLTMDPHDPQILYVCIEGEIYRTTDGAQSWHSYSDGTQLSNGTYRCHGVLVDRVPSSPKRLWSGTINAGAPGGVFYREDSGQLVGPESDWNRIWSVENDAWTLVQDPLDPDVLYCATVHGRVRRSLDAGVTWTDLIVSNPVIPNMDAGTALAVGVSQGRSVLFLSFHGRFYRGVVDPNDATIDWLYYSGPGGAWTIQVAPSNNAVAYASTDRYVTRTTNGGESWNLIGDWPAVRGPTSISVQKYDPNVVYIGSFAQGVYKTTNGGASVTQVSNGLPSMAPVVSHFTFGRSSPDTCYAFVRGLGLYRSQDHAETWSLLNDDASLGFVVDSAVLDPADVNWFAASRFGARYTYANGGGPASTWTGAVAPYVTPTRVSEGVDHVFMGADAVRTWHPVYMDEHDRHAWIDFERLWWMHTGWGVNVIQEGLSVRDIDHDPTNRLRGWATVARAANPAGRGLYRTADGWETKAQILSGDYRTVAIHPQNPTWVYAMNAAGSGSIHVSENDGSSWTSYPVSGGTQVRLRFSSSGDLLWHGGTIMQRLHRNQNGSYSISTLPTTGLPPGHFFHANHTYFQGIVQDPYYVDDLWVICVGEIHRYGTQ